MSNIVYFITFSGKAEGVTPKERMINFSLIEGAFLKET